MPVHGLDMVKTQCPFTDWINGTHCRGNPLRLPEHNARLRNDDILWHNDILARVTARDYPYNGTFITMGAMVIYIIKKIQKKNKRKVKKQ